MTAGRRTAAAAEESNGDLDGDIRQARADKTRIQVVCWMKQREILEAAASAKGATCNDYVLAHALAAAQEQGHAKVPVVISPEASVRLCAAAKRQGTTPAKLLEQILLAAK